MKQLKIYNEIKISIEYIRLLQLMNLFELFYLASIETGSWILK